MHVVQHILLLLLAFVLQTSWVHLLEISQLYPDLIVLTLVYIALAGGQFEAILLGFGIGFLQDTYTPAYLGLNALTKSIVGFALGYGRLRIVADTLPVQVTLIFCTVLAHTNPDLI